MYRIETSIHVLVVPRYRRVSWVYRTERGEGRLDGTS